MSEQISSANEHEEDQLPPQLQAKIEELRALFAERVIVWKEPLYRHSRRPERYAHDNRLAASVPNAPDEQALGVYFTDGPANVTNTVTQPDSLNPLLVMDARGVEDLEYPEMAQLGFDGALEEPHTRFAYATGPSGERELRNEVVIFPESLNKLDGKTIPYSAPTS